MSPPDGGDKPPQTGLVDMGNISFYDEPGVLPPFNLSDLYNYSGSFSEIVLNVTWAELQPTESGPLNTAPIDNAIAALNTFNAIHGTDIGISLRVWGGYTAPQWAKTIDGPAITVTGPGGVDPGETTPETVGRFWTADYINAWTSFQNELGATYDDNPVIRGISNTAGAWNTDEPFSQGPISEMAQLQAGGYTDPAEELTLRAGIADYSAWSTTPLDYSISIFRVEAADNSAPDPNFSLAVLQEAENSGRIVQAGNHALNNPLPSWATFLYAQITADAALNPNTVPASYQTDSTSVLGSQANWPNAIMQGVAADGSTVEIWDTPTTQGFTSQSPSAIAALATDLANGVAPTTGAPDDGAPLGFIAPGSVTAQAGTIPFSGTGAILLASASGAPSYTVTITSADGNTLTAVEDRQAVSGTTLNFSGPLAEINTILASLADSVPSGTDTITVTATDSDGNSATRTVGVIAYSGPAPDGTTVQPTPPTPGNAAAYDWTGNGANGVFSNAANWSPSGGPPGQSALAEFDGIPGAANVAGSGAAGALITDSTVVLEGGSTIAIGTAGSGDVEIADQPATTGTLVLAGVEATLSIGGNLDVGGTATSGGGNGTLLAALAPSDYSTTSLSVAGALNVWDEGTVRFSGALSAAVVDISGGTIAGDGTLATTNGGSVVNDGTIEAVADQTLGLEQLAVAAPLSGDGEIAIDAGAELSLAGGVEAGQTIAFGAPNIQQLSNGPYSPTTLILESPSGFAGAITGFSFADQLVLNGVSAASVTYSPGTLVVTPAGGGTSMDFALSGGLAGMQPIAATSGSGNAATTTISFVAPASGALPSVAAPSTLEAAAGIPVAVPDIVLEAPFPTSGSGNMTVNVAISSGAGTLAVASLFDGSTVSQPSPGLLTLSGTLDAVERTLQTLTYLGTTAGADYISISVSDYAGTSAPALIAVTSGNAGSVYLWSGSGSGSFAGASEWTTGGAAAATAPGGADLAAFGPGVFTATGNASVGEITDTGALTLTGSVQAEGLAGEGTAVLVDSGGALTLSGGAVLTAAQSVIVGRNGDGSLALMGGALVLTGAASVNELVIGEGTGSSGTVVDLEEITSPGSMVVGEDGSGTLQILGVAASVSDLSADIGQADSSDGSVIVDGAEWTTSGWLTVGDAGSGAILIDGAANGLTGQATAANATIGHQAGSSGTVTVDGGDLLVANATASSSVLLVGGGGAGTLVVSDGGNVTVGVALTTVDGATNTGTLILGNAPGGSGLLSVSGGASVEVDGSTTIGQSGGTGSVDVGAGTADTALFAMAGTLTVDATGKVTLNGPGALVRASAVAVAPGGTISGAGTVSGDGGGNDTVLLAGINNSGTIAASGGSLLLYGTVSGTGTLVAESDSTLILQAAVGPGQTVLFGQDSVLALNDAGAFHATVDGFSSGDTIDIASMPTLPSGTASFGANDVLKVTEGSETYYLAFNPAQDFSQETFELSPDGSWGTALTLVDQPSDPPPSDPPQTIEESAASVSADLDQLDALAQSGDLSKILLTDPGIPTLTMPAAQFASDATVLRFIAGPFNVNVSNGSLQGSGTSLQSLNPGTSTSAASFTFVDGTMDYSNTGPASEIERLYQTLLDRAPDPDGAAFWINQLQAGTPLVDIASDFLQSAEYQGKFGATAGNPTSFVTQLYESGLGRSPDPGGLAFWVGQLTSGQMSEAQVAIGISQSNEAIGDSAPAMAVGLWAPNQDAEQVARLYYAALDRPPDLGGLEGWASQLEQGTMTLAQIAGDFLSSSEFISKFAAPSNAEFVSLMYEDGLSRAPDPGGYAFWLNNLDSGAMNRTQVLLGISQSPEAFDHWYPAIDAHGITFV